MCHPGGGNALDPGKSLNTASFLKRYPTDEQVAQRIREGSPNGTMPAFRKDQMSDQDLVDVIAYIRSLNKPKATSTKILCPPAKQTVPIKQPQKKAKSKSA
jgi:mono/diheme cytochrome c family protein